MSEPITVSPLLDGFAMGSPISEHNGIRCCPAIKENTDKKYIVKIVTVPASQAQMDALLLAGAYKDPSDAMDYFREKGEEVITEAELLKKLSKLDGFLSYEGWQMEPITRHRLGYEVYLVGSYKRSLERYIRHNAVTHLEAINLGLDMCSALSVARQAGALYVDLKPSNIFMSDKKEYRIGDLGFLSLDTLHYAALPEKYLSPYTPPELFDPMASVGMSTDTYALGMILYQLYNDGSLPFKGMAPAEGLPSPVQADYELAEIIMKAIHPDPLQRYQDPAEMGKALAEYMQRNSVNDVAITPLHTKKAKRKKKKPAAPVKTQESSQEEVQDLPAEPSEESTPVIAESTESEEPAEIHEVQETLPAKEESTEQETAEQLPTEEPEAEEVPEEAPLNEEPEDPYIPDEDAQEEVTDYSEDWDEDSDPEEPEDAESVEEPSESQAEAEEIFPEEELALSEELSRILSKANDLIAHEPPAGYHFPEEAELPDPFAFAQDAEDVDNVDDSDIPYDPLMDEPAVEEKPKEKKRSEKRFADPKYKRRRKRFFGVVLGILVLALGIMAGLWYYQNLYLVPIESLVITGDRSQIIVQVDSPGEDDQLHISCLDSYGNKKSQTLTNGQAVFTGLESNTMYTIRVEIDGFHSLSGKTSDVFTTDANTTIVSFTSVAGSTDGSVVLSFTVDGDEPEHWAVVYSAEGEEPIRETFKGHSVNIDGLSLGKRYTFTLESGTGGGLGGNTTLELLASRLILAENITVTSSGTDMTIRWNTPGDVVVDSWDVRCYNDMGYDQTLTVANTEVIFSGIDFNWDYTIEVTASGMTQPARTGITANPIQLRSMTIEEPDAQKLSIHWEHEGNAPEGGWLLMYTIDGSESHVIQCDKASAEIANRIPGGKYIFTLQSADGTSVFNNIHSHTATDAQSFEANNLRADMLTIDLLKRPSEERWYCENVADDQLTNQFQSGDSISIILRSSDSFYLPGSRTAVLYVIRDAYGNVLGQHSKEEELIWKDIWTGGDSKNGELNVPSVPANPGSYTLDLYFDGMHVAQLPFTIS